MTESNNPKSIMKSLFEQTDKRLNDIEKEKQKLEKEKEELEQIKIEENKRITEKFAESIRSLVNETLTTASSNTGPVSVSNFDNMGYTISNDTLDSWQFHVLGELARKTHTGYKIDDEGLHIILNYSKWGEGCVDETYGGNLNDENIDYDYLAELLKPYSIFAEKIERCYENCGDGSREYIKFIEITALRKKELEAQFVKKRATKYSGYKDKFEW